jgi:hypothetical protein
MRLTCSTAPVLDNHVAFQSQLSPWLAPTRVTSFSIVYIKILAFCLSGCTLANPSSARSHTGRSGYVRISVPAPWQVLFLQKSVGMKENYSVQVIQDSIFLSPPRQLHAATIGQLSRSRIASKAGRGARSAWAQCPNC